MSTDLNRAKIKELIEILDQYPGVDKPKPCAEAANKDSSRATWHPEKVLD